MTSFAVIAEGHTDQIVIKHILLGYFQLTDEPIILPLQPAPTARRDDRKSWGGWNNVFESLKRGDCQQVLNNYQADFLIIHIDADVQEDTGFDVPKREGGRELEVPERIERIAMRLSQEIGEDFATLKDRILFAIAVDEIECWLLPLLYSDPKKSAKTTGCLSAANRELSKNQNGLSKDRSRSYEAASKPYSKIRELQAHRDRNPSLSYFVAELDRRFKLAAGPPLPNL